MKHRGDNAPANAFTMEEQPKHPGFVLVRFYENVQAFSETKDGLTISGYEYDEYYLELENRDGLQDEILNSFDSFFAEAKAAASESVNPATLEQRVGTLEETVNEVLSAQADALSELGVTV